MIGLGQKLDNRYELKEFVGKGGMAIVYRAEDCRTGHSVAVKVLRPELNEDKEFVARFDREANAASQMQNHNIVNLLDVGIEDNCHYLVMEYVQGKTLKQVIEEHAPLSEEIAAKICVRILSALQHAHDHKIIHRDIKPQNILVDGEGHIKVSDFGIARVADSNTIAKQDSVMGSAQYISPEQAKGEDVSNASDIYSVGIVLYEMLTGHVPFDGETPVAIALQHLHVDAVPVRELNKNVSPYMESIVKKAMEKRVGDRYQNAKDMARDLNRIIDKRLNPGDDDKIVEIADVRKTASAGNSRGNTNTGSRFSIVNLIISLACVIVSLGVIAFSVSMIINALSVIEVPYVIGYSEEEAQNKILERGLQYKLERRCIDERYPAGYVCGVSPDAGTHMNGGETVYLVISTGGAIQEVPDFEDMTREKAVETAQKYGFTVVFDDAKRMSVKMYDTVLAQSVPAGTQAKSGTEIRLTLSGGEIVIPSLVGMTTNEALAELSRLGVKGKIEIQSIRKSNADKYDVINAQQFQTTGGVPRSEGQTVMQDVDVVLFRVMPADTVE